MIVNRPINDIYDSGYRVGFKIEDNKLELLLPTFLKNKELSEDEKTKEMIRYLKLMRKYKNSSKELKDQHINYMGASQENNYLYSIFEAYYLLLMDYMKLGPFVFTDSEINQKLKGRLNWNRTINKSKLLISDDNHLYTNPFYSNKNIDYNHPLTIIYGIYLQDIERQTGIKLNLHGAYRNIIMANQKSINIMAVLDSFKNKLFRDRERKVLNLLHIINHRGRKLDSRISGDKLHYLEDLNNIWEVMLKFVLEDEYYNLNRFFPKGEYDLTIEDKKYNRMGLRIIPDIIKEYGGKLYIIDAKNYLPHINNGLPGSVDINKQILYRYFLSKEFNMQNKYSLKDIINIFLLPNDLQGSLIKRIGKHRIINIDNSLGDIFLYHLDFNQVVDAYLDNNMIIRNTILSTLKNTIDQ